MKEFGKGLLSKEERVIEDAQNENNKNENR